MPWPMTKNANIKVGLLTILTILQNYIVPWEQGVVRFCVGRFDIYYWFGPKGWQKYYNKIKEGGGHLMCLTLLSWLHQTLPCDISVGIDRNGINSRRQRVQYVRGCWCYDSSVTWWKHNLFHWVDTRRAFVTLPCNYNWGFGRWLLMP